MLLADAEMPPMLASRLWVDFRGADGPLYFEKVGELTRALRGEKDGPSGDVGSELLPPPGTGYRAAGTLFRRLTIDAETATLHGGDAPVSADVRGLDHADEERLWQLRRAFARPGVTERRDDEAPRTSEPPLYRRQLDAGDALARAFLPCRVMPVRGSWCWRTSTDARTG